MVFRRFQNCQSFCHRFRYVGFPVELSGVNRFADYTLLLGSSNSNSSSNRTTARRPVLLDKCNNRVASLDFLNGAYQLHLHCK